MDADGSPAPQDEGGLPDRPASAEARRIPIRSTSGPSTLLGVLVGGVPLVVAAVFLVLAARDARLEREGEPAAARIVVKRYFLDDDGATLRVDYEFVATDGRTYEGDFSPNRSQYDSLQEGDRIEIRYSASDPSVSVVVGQRRVSLARALTFLSVLVFAAGSFFLVGVLMRRRRQVQASGPTTCGGDPGATGRPRQGVEDDRKA